MKTLAACVGLILGASWAFGGAGGRSITLDINQQDRAFSNTVSRGEAFDWEVYLTRGGAAYTNETITGGGIYYSTNRTASAWVVFPFSSWSATAGRVVCRMAATNSMGLSTNSADYPIPYDASIILTTSNNVYRWRQGVLTITDDGSVSGSGIAAATSTMVPNSRTITINGVTYDLSENRSWTVSTTATLPAGTVAATNQGVAGQSLFWNAGAPTGVSTGYWATASGSGDMLASMYDPNSVQRGVVFTNDQRVTLALTNGALYATAAQGVAATNAQYRVSVIETNYASLSYASQAALAAYQDATNYSLIATTNEIAIHNTNTLAHLNLASVAYVTNQLAGYVATNDARYLAAVTNGGATINGSPITNGAAFTITGGGGGGGISNIAVAGVTGTLTGSGSNVVASVSLASLAAAGVITNGVKIAAATNANYATMSGTASNLVGVQSNTLATALQPVSTQNLVTVTQLVDYAPTNTISYYAAPVCYQVTITNLSETWFTNVFNPTQVISRVTATSTGKMNFVMLWPSNQMAYWGFCYDATGRPSTVFPEGAVFFTNGLYSATAPSLGASNFISVMHSCASYQIMVFTNSLGTWGTP